MPLPSLHNHGCYWCYLLAFLLQYSFGAFSIEKDMYHCSKVTGHSQTYSALILGSQSNDLSLIIIIMLIIIRSFTLY